FGRGDRIGQSEALQLAGAQATDLLLLLGNERGEIEAGTARVERAIPLRERAPRLIELHPSGQQFKICDRRTLPEFAVEQLCAPFSLAVFPCEPRIAVTECNTAAFLHAVASRPSFVRLKYADVDAKFGGPFPDQRP